MKSLPASLIAIGLGTAAQAQIALSPATVAATGMDANAAAFADFDGDGFVDMAVTTDGNGNQDLLELHRGAGDGTFALAAQVLLPNSSSPHGVVASDFDGDGDADVAVGLADTGQVILLSNVGPFAFAQTSSAATGGQESRTLVGSDLDGDGDTDLVLTNRDSNDVSVVLNSNGALVAAGRVPAGDEPRDVAVGDFNGDGIADLAVSSHDDRTVRVLNGAGGGVFAAGQVLGVPVGTRPQGMAAADMDGDGDLDLVVGAGDDNNAAQNFVAVYLNIGTGLSGALASPTGGLDAGDVAVGDLDGDGDADVAVGNETSGTISLLSNTGGGVLTLDATVFPVGLPDTLALADVDGNGSLDLASTRRQTGGVAVFVNDLAAGVGTEYCPAVPNSTGQSARLLGAGSAILAQNDLTVTCDRLPVNVFGLFLTAQVQDFVPGAGGSQGNLCLGVAIGRYNSQVFQSGATGAGSLTVDWTNLPQPSSTASAVAGQVWNFQCWYRDTLAGTDTSNYSSGLSVTVQ